MKLTGLDALAIAIGTSHGAYKFSSKPADDTLKMERLIEIHKRLPNTHLVMHGSSSVPQDLQDIINQYGGKLKPTWGVPVEEIQLGIRNGVRKINVDTDNRLAMTGAIRKVLMETPDKFDLSDYLKPARVAMQKVRGSPHDAVRPGRPRKGLHAGFAGCDGEAARGRSGPGLTQFCGVPPLPGRRGNPGPPFHEAGVGAVNGRRLAGMVGSDPIR